MTTDTTIQTAEEFARQTFEGCGIVSTNPTPETWMAAARQEYVVSRATIPIVNADDKALTDHLAGRTTVPGLPKMSAGEWADFMEHLDNLVARYEGGAETCRAASARILVALSRLEVEGFFDDPEPAA